MKIAVYVSFALYAVPALLEIFTSLNTPVSVFTISMMTFCVIHAAYVHGWRNALAFLGFSCVISWTYEEIGTLTGIVYGNYTYSDMLGLKLGHVPLLIPVAWFMMIYPSHVIANLVVTGKPFGTDRDTPITKILWLSFVAAMVMTSWDVIIDPGMSAKGNWTWHDGGMYFGVPVHNYFGWMLTTFSVYLAYRLWERAKGIHAMGEANPLITMMPVLIYGIMVIRYVLSPSLDPQELRLVAFFVMGFPCLLAMGKLVFSEREEQNPT